MEGHRAITLKTQVRRLRYFQVMCSALRKSGFPIDVLQRISTEWAQDHIDDVKTYVSPSGEIRASTTDKPSQSFRFYYGALVRLGLAHEFSGLVTNSRIGAVLKHLPIGGKKAGSNPFFLSVGEKALFLFVLIEQDADYFLTVLRQVAMAPGETLAYYQGEFQGAYISRLSSRLSEAHDSRYIGEIQDARQRANDWRAPKRYSEDIVPTRINWLIDLEMVSVGSNRGRAATYNLTAGGDAFRQSMIAGIEYDDVADDWHQSAFVHTCTQAFKNNAQPWNTISEDARVQYATECLEICRKHFGSSLLPRLPADQTFLYSCLYLLLVRSVAVEVGELKSWIGYERQLGVMRVGYRKSARVYESYVAISHG